MMQKADDSEHQTLFFTFCCKAAVLIDYLLLPPAVDFSDQDNPLRLQFLAKVVKRCRG